MLIKDVMSRPPVTVTPFNSAFDAWRMMKDRRIRRLPVIEEGALVGIVTDRDIRDANISRLADLPKHAWDDTLREIQVRQIMTRGPVSLSPDDPVELAAILMRRHKIGGMPVVKSGVVVGVITESDIFRIFSTIFGAEPGYLRIALEDTQKTREVLPEIFTHYSDRIQTLLFSRESPEVLLVFKAPGGKRDFKEIFDDLRGYDLYILNWDLFESVIEPSGIAR